MTGMERRVCLPKDGYASVQIIRRDRLALFVPALPSDSHGLRSSNKKKKNAFDFRDSTVFF